MLEDTGLVPRGIPIGIGRILTNPPSHTTRRAGPHRAVPQEGLEAEILSTLTPRAGYTIKRRSYSSPDRVHRSERALAAPLCFPGFGPSPCLPHYRPAFDYYDLG
jgi:hypothetical protein